MLNTRLAYSDSLASLPRRPDAPLPAARDARPGSREDQAPPALEKAAGQGDARHLVKALNKALQGINTGLEFSQDDQTGWTVIKVIDRETKETIRQIPSEEALAIAHFLDERTKGVLLRQTV